LHAQANVRKVRTKTGHADLREFLTLIIEDIRLTAGIAADFVSLDATPVRTTEIITSISGADHLGVAEIATVGGIHLSTIGHATGTLGEIVAGLAVSSLVKGHRLDVAHQEKRHHHHG